MVARLKRIEHWRLAVRTIWRGPRTALAGLTGHDLANHHPVEQMAQGGEAQCRGRRGSRLLRREEFKEAIGGARAVGGERAGVRSVKGRVDSWAHQLVPVDRMTCVLQLFS
jgi:hypothetical protein